MTPLDIFIRRIRPLILLVAALSLPGFFLSYFYMMALAYEVWPLWGFACMGVSHIILWIGVACLFDEVSERRSR